MVFLADGLVVAFRCLAQGGFLHLWFCFFCVLFLRIGLFPAALPFLLLLFFYFVHLEPRLINKTSAGSIATLKMIVGGLAGLISLIS